MKKGIVLGMVILVIGVSFTGSSYSLSMSKSQMSTFEGNILYVGGSGEGNYTKIQDAIDNASDGDTVFVFNGTYNVRMNPDYGLVVNKSINLIGEDKDTTIIDGNNSWFAVYISSDWVNISKFTVRNGVFSGFFIASNHTSITRNNIVSNMVYGLGIFYSNDNEISSNIISDNLFGLSLAESSNNLITGNNISDNLGYGLTLEESCGNTITKNNINSNINGCGLFIIGYSNDNVIIDNNISNNQVGITLDLSMFNKICNNNINLNNDYGIKLDESSNSNIIYHNNFNNEYNAYDKCDNTWDDGKYGNYWSDYEERYPDAKPKLFKPWMWNTPYEIPGGNNTDNCPLVKQWPNSVSIDIPRNRVNYNSLFLRFLEHFPLLERLLDIWRLNLE